MERGSPNFIKCISEAFSPSFLDLTLRTHSTWSYVFWLKESEFDTKEVDLDNEAIP